ncbi:PA0069 family radical SAM protein [Fodinicurvata sediminis]|uniref:PA0069 family radical SAM protein n=1 Tax=Fodinicurvata sediminis TaxID=1121832 RepID=UPI000684832B|nr:PA0069 family radical SAM protein [Fodinicurvata sediminis]
MERKRAEFQPEADPPPESGTTVPDCPRKGRGAVGNPEGRFDPESRHREHDGWDPEEEEPGLQTIVYADAARSILSHNDSPDVPLSRSLNPYRGCEHGCIYCFARPSHSYLGLSPGLDFESRIFAKHAAAELLRQELAKPSYRPEVIALGSNTDPYQPVERKLRITRGVLEVLLQARHPVTLITKSTLVLRDLDLLQELAQQNLVRVCLSITTLDGKLARNLEPRAATPMKRLATLQKLNQAGIPVTVLSAPMIPGLNDSELEAILEAAAERGADRAGYVLLRLPHELGALFENWLDTHMPERKNRVLKLVKETRAGHLYESRWGTRMKGRGVYADLLRQRFETATRRLKLNRTENSMDCNRFRAPRDPRQFELF